MKTLDHIKNRLKKYHGFTLFVRYVMTTHGSKRRSRGFSLVEVAVVLVIVGLLVGGLLSPLSEQRERARLAQSTSERDDIMEALIGFAVSQGRLPCPATHQSNGREAGDTVPPLPPTRCLNGGTAFQHGFVPAVTLGLNGEFNGDGLLLDPWDNPWRYSIARTNANAGTDAVWDFIGEGQMSLVGMGSLNPNLVVCDQASANAGSCSAGNELVSNAVVVVYSMGKDWASYASAAQQENAGEGAGVALGTYPVAGDRVFVSQSASVRDGNEFDDQISWLSPNVLYARMLQAGVLP